MTCLPDVIIKKPSKPDIGADNKLGVCAWRCDAERTPAGIIRKVTGVSIDRTSICHMNGQARDYALKSSKDSTNKKRKKSNFTAKSYEFYL